jgi:phosphoribosylaminoimidazolecarboxamide formyltransferase / IMP cyclohydrolase
LNTNYWVNKMTTATLAPHSPHALLSVSDKAGITEFAQGLLALGFTLLSTGGTAKLLRDSGIACTDVAQYTGFAEMMDGRVKTLHPKVHGGLLARRDTPAHLAAMQAHGIAAIDVVAVNLYPFAATVANPNVSLEDAVENIDIGGPAMLRSAAKNHATVSVVCEPADYPAVLASLQTGSQTQADRLAFRRSLAAKVYAHTARYDGMIANFLSSLPADGSPQAKHAYPQTLTVQFNKVQDLRYGENPHQNAAFYTDTTVPKGLLADYTQLHGKALSYNNIADADAAWECVRQFDATSQPACVIVKHANPCGVAIANDLPTAYAKAFSTDTTSAFGGILAFNREVDEATALAISKQFAELVLAPSYSAAALTVLQAKVNVRLLTVPLLNTQVENTLEFKRVGGGLLVQSPDNHRLRTADLQCVTDKKPSAEQLTDLQFAWQVAQFVKSNAIVYCKDGMTLGIGAGQMSRVDSAKIAALKAQHAGFSLQGCVVASDAFFPFRDGLDVLAQAGAVAVVQPGGSMRDNEVIAAANEQGVAMVFTGIRHFRH